MAAIIPDTLQRPAFTLATPPLTPIDSLSSVLSAYLHRAGSTFSSVFSSFHFGDSDDISSLTEFIADSERPSFAAVELSKLHNIGKKYGKSSPQYIQAAEILRSLLESLVQDDRATFAILTYATSSSASLVKRDAPQESQVPFPLPGPQQPIGAISTCFTSLDSCNNSTSSCSGRGQCSQASKAGRTCFVCTCGATTTGEGNQVKTTYWAGESCERKDVSRYFIALITTKESTQCFVLPSPFVLITGTVVVVILLFAGAVSLLSSVGDQSLPSTLLATAVPVKKE